MEGFEKGSGRGLVGYKKGSREGSKKGKLKGCWTLKASKNVLVGLSFNFNQCSSARVL